MLTEIQKDIIEQTSRFVQHELINIESGHDWWHSWRVCQMASHLALKENADIFICSLAALLHDVSDPKFNETNDNPGPTKTKLYLYGLGMKECIRDTVLHIVENISFSAGISNELKKSIEFAVIQDADMLDAIGAIGIARTFNYGGFKNKTIHLPDSAPSIYGSTLEYRMNNSTTIMHFYEKLLLLRERMNTQTARTIANERHQYLVDFLERFFLEWNEFSEQT